MKYLISFIFLVFSISAHANEFDIYLKAQNESIKEYKSEIKKYWPISEISTTHKWVEYEDDYSTKKSVNFYSGDIALEVIAKDTKEAKKRLEKLYVDLLGDSVKSAYSKDKLEEKIFKKLNKPKQIYVSEEKIIANILSEEDTKNMLHEVKTQKLKIEKYNDTLIYKIYLKLPADFIVKKAKTFSEDVQKSSQKEQIPANLIYSIIEIGSSFNPMARSHVPAYGLMQIVPKTAGVESYEYLYGKKKIPNSNYLYDAGKNIAMGSAYLHILYNEYLKGIKDPQSELYCAIASYNSGVGNVSKAFTGDTNIYEAIKTINNMSPKSVYKYLIQNLPNEENSTYLKKVVDKLSFYQKLMEKKEL